MENKVALVKCDSYEQEKVDEAVLDAFNYLGGIQKFIKMKLIRNFVRTLKKSV